MAALTELRGGAGLEFADGLHRPAAPVLGEAKSSLTSTMALSGQMSLVVARRNFSRNGRSWSMFLTPGTLSSGTTLYCQPYRRCSARFAASAAPPLSIDACPLMVGVPSV